MASLLDSRIVQAAPIALGQDAEVIVVARVGSDSHGTHIPKEDGGVDDVDILGGIMPPVRYLIGLDNWNHWTRFVDELDVVFYSFPKMVRLWLKSNPNVLGLLWMRPEDILVSSQTFEWFRAQRELFVCTQVADAFGGYAYSQLRDMQKNRHEGYMGSKRRELVERFGYDVKHAAHLIRLLRMATEFLREGQLNVYRTHDADELISIKRGEWSLERVQKEAGDLFALVDELKAKSALPERPDRERVDRMLIEVTRSYIADH